MAVDTQQRVRHWDKKYDTARVKGTLDAMRGRMLAHYEAAVTNLCRMETEVKQTLDGIGVQTILYVPYLNYGRQLYKLSHGRSISGGSLAIAAQVLLNKWASRGLDPAVLAKIREDVFSIPPPA